MVTDLHDAERGRRQRKSFQRLEEFDESFQKNCSWNTQNKSVNKYPEFKSQIFETN